MAIFVRTFSHLSAKLYKSIVSLDKSKQQSERQIKAMQVRWNYKLQPNKGQRALMAEWLVTLRKHRNYCLSERQRGFESNNQYSDQPVMYEHGAFCNVDSRVEYGSYCPLTCPVIKHGVMSAGLTKSSKGQLRWGNVSDVQGKRTTELRSENAFYRRINADVLQGNLAKLDAAYAGFFKHQRGFPAFRRASNFNSFQYKPGVAKLNINRTAKRNKRTGERKKCYSHVYLPGLGNMRFLDSREIPEDADICTIVVKREADGWYMSVLLTLPGELPELKTEIQSSVGMDVGINKLVSLSDGSFVKNPKFATNKKTRRLMRIRQRRVNRKVKGSKNRAKAGLVVAKLHKQIADKREAHQWQAANKIVKTADAVVYEDLNIKGMKSRCKPKKASGRFMPNGQSAKRGLNRSISDAAWGGLLDKVGWIGAKAGKPVMAVNAAYTSQECSACGYCSKDNRDGEKFICEACGHVDHADTQASRTINKKVGFEFVSNRHKKPSHNRKCLAGDSRKVTPIIDAASDGKRHQAGNWTSKAMPENQILVNRS
jgi:putative transposase